MFLHSFPKHILRLLLQLVAGIKSAPKPIYLIFNILSMRRHFTWVPSKLFAFFLRVLLVLTEVVCNLDEPHARADENVHVLNMRLHGGHSLDR